MESNYSRRNVLTLSALALAGSALAGTRAPASTPNGAKFPVGNPKPDQASANKTRTASCACGQLKVTTKGPEPERISLCHCKLCQRQTGSAFSIQATFPKDQVTIDGKSKGFRFPVPGAPPVTYRNCSRTGVTTHFCPECGSTVYYVLDETPNNIGVKVGTFTDPTFPPPMISGFEEYRLPWALNVSALPMPGGHHT